MKICALLLAVLLLPATALAEEKQFEDGEAVRLQPDKAYLLARTDELVGHNGRGFIMISPVLYRELSAAELEAAQKLAEQNPEHWQEKAEPNVVVMVGDVPYQKANGERLMLTTVKPGTYVLGGIAFTSAMRPSRGFMTTSLCMGTVKFEAKAGVITDLGTILAAYDDKPTTIPELAKIVTGTLPEPGIVSYAVAVRPTSQAVPDSLRDLARTPANYRAVPAFPNYPGALLGRLAPLPGVLDYDKDGEVIDLKARP